MNSEQERRDFFRIDTQVAMRLEPLENKDVKRELPAALGLLQKLKVIDTEQANLFSDLAEKNYQVAQLLKLQNQKIELLVTQVVQDNLDGLTKVSANLSGGGLRWQSDTPYKTDSQYQLLLVLLPADYGLSIAVTVTDCQKHDNKYDCVLSFDSISEQDRDEVIKHITQIQSQQLRKERLGE